MATIREPSSEPHVIDRIKSTGQIIVVSSTGAIQAIWRILAPAIRRYGLSPISVTLQTKVSTMEDSILFNTDSETTAQVVTAILARQGYRIFRSFDLRSALVGHTECECPYHGTAHCTCQFVVLLVYSATAGPVVVTAHSRDAQARLRVVQDALTQPDPHLAGQVMAALREARLTLPVTVTEPTEVTANVR